MTSAADDAAAIAALIAGGQVAAAATQLVAHVGWPAGKDLGAAGLARALALVGDLAAAGGGDELAGLARAAAADLDSPDRLYALGYALIDAGAPAIAASVLWRCLALVGDSEEVVGELVAALESTLAHRDALALLDARPALRAQSGLCQYLWGFNAAMAGRLDLTAAAHASLAPTTAEEAALRATLGDILDRAARLGGAPGPVDLAGWHFVLTGGVLTHRSPYGLDEPMHGRYAWLADSAARVATGLDHLVGLCAGIRLTCVWATPGRSSEILAAAAAARLELPLAPWPTIGVPAPGLVVAYDLADLGPGEARRLAERRPDQVLYAHATPWTVDLPVAADLTTLLYQALVPPWGASAWIDPATGAVDESPPDDRAAEVIAAELAAAPALPADEQVADDGAALAALAARVWPPAPGGRARQWAGGPVPSSRFA